MKILDRSALVTEETNFQINHDVINHYEIRCETTNKHTLFLVLVQYVNINTVLH